MINKYVGRIRTALSWGVENGLVDPGTVAKLRVLRALPEGEPGTFDHDPREDVPADVVRITIKYAPPNVTPLFLFFTVLHCYFARVWTHFYTAPVFKAVFHCLSNGSNIATYVLEVVS